MKKHTQYNPQTGKHDKVKSSKPTGIKKLIEKYIIQSITKPITKPKKSNGK